MSEHPILDLSLRNLTRHDLRHHGDKYNLFCDAFAQFGVGFPGLAPIGIGPVCPKATLSTYHVANPALQLWFQEGENLVSLQRQDMECLPWLTTERSNLPVPEGFLEVVAEHVFKDERTVVSRFTFINNAPAAVTWQPCWKGAISSEHELYMAPYFHGTENLPRTPFLEKIPHGFVGGLRVASPDHDMPQVALRVRECEGKLSNSIEVDRRYAFHSSTPISVEAGAQIRFQFCLEINFLTDDQRDFVWPDAVTAVEDFDALVSTARTRFANAIAIDKPPAVVTPALALKTWRARYALLRNGMRGMDGEYGDEIACLCTSDNTDFSCVFFWDTLFSSVAIADFHQKYAQGAIRTAFVRTDPRDGSSPERKFNYSPKGRMAQQSPQSPVASWAVRAYLEKHDDPAFLAEMYPRLISNHGFWETYSDVDRDGLAEYRWSGQVCDNSPLWDPYAALDATTGCGWLPPVASVALNSFLFWDANHLAVLADQQNLADDAARFRARASQLQRDLFAVCYVPGEKRFWDFNHHTQEHRRVKTFYMFWPLFAGMEVPAEATRDLIENVLLDPSQFFGEIPFPSTAYDEPTYDPKGYWRGRAWPHITYWLLQTLVRHGYVKEAKEAARRTLAAFSRSSGFPENIASKPEYFDASGFADYNWGCAAIYLIATDEYLKA